MLIVLDKQNGLLTTHVLRKVVARASKIYVVLVLLLLQARLKCYAFFSSMIEAVGLRIVGK